MFFLPFFYVIVFSMRHLLYPSETSESTYSIPFDRLYEEGYRGIIFDIDNTLVEHGAPADVRSRDLLNNLREMGFSVFLLSNNRKARVEMFNEGIGVPYISAAAKPLTFNYKKAMKQMGTDVNNTFIVGDQLFTDVWGAKSMGLKSILVKPINAKEEIQIVIKRKFEAIILSRYNENENMV